jgi:hypothetical protein
LLLLLAQLVEVLVVQMLCNPAHSWSEQQCLQRSELTAWGSVHVTYGCTFTFNGPDSRLYAAQLLADALVALLLSI